MTDASGFRGKIGTFGERVKMAFTPPVFFKLLLDEKTKNNFNLSEAELTSSFWVKRSKASKILPRARIQKFQPSSKMTFKEFGEAGFLSFFKFFKFLFFMIRFFGPSSVAVACLSSRWMAAPLVYWLWV